MTSDQGTGHLDIYLLYINRFHLQSFVLEVSEDTCPSSLVISFPLMSQLQNDAHSQ